MTDDQCFWITRHYSEISNSGIFLVDVEVLAPQDGRDVIHSFNVDPNTYRKMLKKHHDTRKYCGTKIVYDAPRKWTNKFQHIPRELWFGVPHLHALNSTRSLCSISVYTHEPGSRIAYTQNVEDLASPTVFNRALTKLAKSRYDKFVLIDSSSYNGDWLPENITIHDTSDEELMLLRLRQ